MARLGLIHTVLPGPAVDGLDGLAGEGEAAWGQTVAAAALNKQAARRKARCTGITKDSVGLRTRWCQSNDLALLVGVLGDANKVKRSMFPKEISTISEYLDGSSPRNRNLETDATSAKTAPVKSTASSSEASIDTTIRLSPKVVIRPRRSTNEAWVAEANSIDIKAEAFFQAWISARPSLSAVEFIALFNSAIE